MKVGLGYDVHRLVKGRKLFLGGVEIPCKRGPLAHSDGDVILHAVSDALLGAMGRGDIGDYFPDTEPKYKDMASAKILYKILAIMKSSKLKIENLDITLIAREPKIAPYKKKIRNNIAKILEAEPDDINIKATTNEGIGFIGKGEAIAALAVVTLQAIGCRQQAAG